MVKYGFLYLFLFSIGYGANITTSISFSGEPISSIRTIVQSFNSIGYKLDIESLVIREGRGELYAKAIGNKGFDPALLAENLKEQLIHIERVEVDKQKLTLLLDTQNVFWNIFILGRDESSELKKVNIAQWFRVESGQRIHIEAPYSGVWYPDIAILDSRMKVITSFRSIESKEELEFDLPEGACYLKISNTYGMKVLKEGMWIESSTPRQ